MEKITFPSTSPPEDVAEKKVVHQLKTAGEKHQAAATTLILGRVE